MDNEKRSWDIKLKNEEADRSELSEELKILEQAESTIKESELSMVSLYEVTKKMSEDLKFTDIFNVFSSFLKGNFTFRNCELLILNWDGPSPRLERRYSVCEMMGGAAEANVNYKMLIKTFTEDPKKIYFSRAGDKDMFEALEIDDKAITTYAGIPLVSDGRVVAILTVENLPREELEKFIILSMQFALEIKKVLLYETVEKLATTDSLTGLYVRQYFSERLGEELQRSKRYKLKFALLMIDIDDFKKTNDTYGHLVGDVILKSLGQILKESTREIDMVSRYGGEEFTVGLPETETSGAKIAAERIRRKVEENMFKAYDEKLKVTVSIGLSVYPKDSARLKNLIEKADMAMYEAKKSGKNLVREYKR
ncbi:MAG: sensor domain-containing diguanylate cyclase [Candidatus Omnitrophota bacterium]|nr:sensor domain-containing diguanylate cyclase [Candidatus Omnitrophota bacterium]